MPLRVRPARPDDLDLLLPLRAALWPDEPAGERRAELARILGGRPRGTLPLVVIVAEAGEGLAGFEEVGLRSHAAG